MGLYSKTLLNGPNRSTVTLKPSLTRVCLACPMPMPSTSGMPTTGGPDDTPIVTVSLSLIGVPAAGDCRVMMPCGCELLLSCWTLSVMPFCAAHC